MNLAGCLNIACEGDCPDGQKAQSSPESELPTSAIEAVDRIVKLLGITPSGPIRSKIADIIEAYRHYVFYGMTSTNEKS